jgi:hypothetical protein
MVFKTAPRNPPLPYIPDDIPICDFIFESDTRFPLQQSLDPFTCGISGRSYSAVEVVDRVDALARALANEFNWQPNQGSEWDKVVGVFSINTVGSPGDDDGRDPTPCR